MLILIETDEMPVMHYMADDTSESAINAEIARSGFGGASWRVITQPEYLAIRTARPTPQQRIQAIPETSEEVLQLMLDMANQIQALKADVDRINATPIPTALDLVEVKP